MSPCCFLSPFRIHVCVVLLRIEDVNGIFRAPKIRIITVLLGMLQTFAHAQMPNDVDLRSLFPGLRDQGRVGSCSAQANADLMTAYLKSHEVKGVHIRKGAYVSPFAVAVCGKKRFFDDEFDESNKIRSVY